MNFTDDSLLLTTQSTFLETTGMPEEDDSSFYELSGIELAIWCFLYILIAFMAVVGNLLVLYITCFRLKVRSITTFFILNLGFADLFVGIFAIPFKFQAALFQEWFLPKPLCRIVPYAETVALTVSVFTLVVSAVHEFRTVFFSKCSQMSPKSAKICILLIWVLSVVVSLPHGLFHKTYEMTDENGVKIVQCLPIYADENWWKMYNIYLVVIQYFIPMLILDTAYAMIALKIWSMSKSRVEMDETKLNNQKISVVSMGLQNHQLSQLMRTLIIVVACFTFCWFPLETYLLLNELRPEINGWKYINLVFFFSHWLAMSNSCLNPIIYGLYNTKYNEEYRRVFGQIGCFCCTRRKSLTDSMKPERRWNSSNDAQDQHEIDQIVDIPSMISATNGVPPV
ncbi:unnamed protein product [Caenorhabditis nigoni]